MSELISREEALKEAAKKLDISPSKYRQAMERFSSMKGFLEDGNYEGANSVPDVYLQGSFKLGTEIRPFRNSKDADYDIDLVCRLGHEKDLVQVSTVKNQVGDHLKGNGTYGPMLDDEGKRCWTLNYAEQDGIGFHMDILPSVQETALLLQQDSIAATNKDQGGHYTWTTSNPKGFSQWFYEKNREAFDRDKLIQKQSIYASQRNLFNSTDEVPNIHVKTPLQRSIQLLKRHRDIRFSESDIEKYKPISMIITVLSSLCYRNETSIYDTLSSLIRNLDQQAQQLNTNFVFDAYRAQSTYNLITRTADGKWLIPNPTNPGENFADRWHEDNHARAKAFFQWVAWLKDDFLNINEFVANDRFTKSLVDVYQPANLPALNFNVPHRKPLRWPVARASGYTAEIKATYMSHVYWKSFQSGQPLLKGKDLKFKLKTNVPKPYQVYWQVVNTGPEATNKGQLRGEIIEHIQTGSGDIYRTESTSYIGDHWVEGFVVKDGVCVAKTGEFIVAIRNRF
ncbi:nucleotidyltransferase [Ketobacter sp.]|uniref:nucleotidyltransferase n=1 Tax=Ketobacter sp. TaxID=2083498 RepID=UPI000F2C9FE4|nr:nucleotidyltransferase [Ketobacter sp.]RLU00192.1 MAG: nucleotidyltransferase [Ketobacter sp.]